MKFKRILHRLLKRFIVAIAFVSLISCDGSDCIDAADFGNLLIKKFKLPGNPFDADGEFKDLEQGVKYKAYDKNCNGSPNISKSSGVYHWVDTGIDIVNPSFNLNLKVAGVVNFCAPIVTQGQNSEGIDTIRQDNIGCTTAKTRVFGHILDDRDYTGYGVDDDKVAREWQPYFKNNNELPVCSATIHDPKSTYYLDEHKEFLIAIPRPFADYEDPVDDETNYGSDAENRANKSQVAILTDQAVAALEAEGQNVSSSDRSRIFADILRANSFSFAGSKEPLEYAKAIYDGEGSCNVGINVFRNKVKENGRFWFDPAEHLSVAIFDEDGDKDEDLGGLTGSKFAKNPPPPADIPYEQVECEKTEFDDETRYYYTMDFDLATANEIDINYYNYCEKDVYFYTGGKKLTGHVKFKVKDQGSQQKFCCQGNYGDEPCACICSSDKQHGCKLDGGGDATTGSSSNGCWEKKTKCGSQETCGALPGGCENGGCAPILGVNTQIKYKHYRWRGEPVKYDTLDDNYGIFDIDVGRMTSCLIEYPAVEFRIGDDRPENRRILTTSAVNDEPWNLGRLYVRVVDQEILTADDEECSFSGDIGELKEFFDNNAGSYTVTIKTIKETAVITQLNAALEERFEEIFSDEYREKFFNNLVGDGSVFQTIVKTMFVLYVTMLAATFLLGMTQLNATEIIKRVVRFGLILTVISPGSWEFFNYLILIFEKGSVELSLLMAGSFLDPMGGATANADNSIYRIIDEIIYLLFQPEIHLKISAIFFTVIPLGILMFIMIYYAFFLMLHAIGRSVIVYFVIKIMFTAMFMVGPIFIALAIFDRTKNMFEQWLATIISYAIQVLFLYITIAFFSTLIMTIFYELLYFGVCWKPVWILKLGPLPEFEFFSYWHFQGYDARYSEAYNISRGPDFTTVLFFLTLAYIFKEVVEKITDLGDSIAGGAAGGAGSMAASAMKDFGGALNDGAKAAGKLAGGVGGRAAFLGGKIAIGALKAPGTLGQGAAGGMLAVRANNLRGEIAANQKAIDAGKPGHLSKEKADKLGADAKRYEDAAKAAGRGDALAENIKKRQDANRAENSKMLGELKKGNFSTLGTKLKRAGNRVTGAISKFEESYQDNTNFEQNFKNLKAAGQNAAKYKRRAKKARKEALAYAKKQGMSDKETIDFVKQEVATRIKGAPPQMKENLVNWETDKAQALIDPDKLAAQRSTEGKYEGQDFVKRVKQATNIVHNIGMTGARARMAVVNAPGDLKQAFKDSTGIQDLENRNKEKSFEESLADIDKKISELEGKRDDLEKRLFSEDRVPSKDKQKKMRRELEYLDQQLSEARDEQAELKHKSMSHGRVKVKAAVKKLRSSKKTRAAIAKRNAIIAGSKESKAAALKAAYDTADQAANETIADLRKELTAKGKKAKKQTQKKLEVLDKEVAKKITELQTANRDLLKGDLDAEITIKDKKGVKTKTTKRQQRRTNKAKIAELSKNHQQKRAKLEQELSTKLEGLNEQSKEKAQKIRDFIAKDNLKLNNAADEFGLVEAGVAESATKDLEGVLGAEKTAELKKNLDNIAINYSEKVTEIDSAQRSALNQNQDLEKDITNIKKKLSRVREAKDIDANIAQQVEDALAGIDSYEKGMREVEQSFAASAKQTTDQHRKEFAAKIAERSVKTESASTETKDMAAAEMDDNITVDPSAPPVPEDDYVTVDPSAPPVPEDDDVTVDTSAPPADLDEATVKTNIADLGLLNAKQRSELEQEIAEARTDLATEKIRLDGQNLTIEQEISDLQARLGKLPTEAELVGKSDELNAKLAAIDGRLAVDEDEVKLNIRQAQWHANAQAVGRDEIREKLVKDTIAGMSDFADKTLEEKEKITQDLYVRADLKYRELMLAEDREITGDKVRLLEKAYNAADLEYKNLTATEDKDSEQARNALAERNLLSEQQERYEEQYNKQTAELIALREEVTKSTISDELRDAALLMKDDLAKTLEDENHKFLEQRTMDFAAKEDLEKQLNDVNLELPNLAKRKADLESELVNIELARDIMKADYREFDKRNHQIEQDVLVTKQAEILAKQIPLDIEDKFNNKAKELDVIEQKIKQLHKDRAEYGDRIGYDKEGNEETYSKEIQKQYTLRKDAQKEYDILQQDYAKQINQTIAVAKLEIDMQIAEKEYLAAVDLARAKHQDFIFEQEVKQLELVNSRDEQIAQFVKENPDLAADPEQLEKFKQDHLKAQNEEIAQLEASIAAEQSSLEIINNIPAGIAPAPGDLSAELQNLQDLHDIYINKYDTITASKEIDQDILASLREVQNDTNEQVAQEIKEAAEKAKATEVSEKSESGKATSSTTAETAPETTGDDIADDEKDKPEATPTDPKADEAKSSAEKENNDRARRIEQINAQISLRRARRTQLISKKNAAADPEEKKSLEEQIERITSDIDSLIASTK